MSLERDMYLRELDRVAEKERLAKVRPAVVQGRRTEAHIDATQLPVRQSLQARSPSGAFYFVVGYSIVGGPDVVRP